MQKKIGYIVLWVIVIITGVYMYHLQHLPYVSALIVPHHNLVAKQRAEVFAQLKDRISNRRVILISPNHYSLGTAAIQTRQTDFMTQNGTVAVDQQLLSVALQNGAVTDAVTFETEHGIKVLLPDIAQYTDTSILPLIIKDTASLEQIHQFMSKLYESCPDCVVVASADFSHYQPYLLANLHDDLTLRALATTNTTLISEKAEVGESPVVAAAMYWANMNKTEHFVTYNHTNSTEIENNYYAEGTTHIYGWYEQGQSSPPPQEVSFTFVGDIFFDRAIRQKYHPHYTEMLQKLGDRVLWGTDVVMGNLEGPVTDKDTLVSAYDMPRFHFSPLVGTVLSNLHFTHLNLRNNHALDAGQAGLEDTKNVLQKKNIYCFCAADNTSIINGSDQNIVIVTVDVTKNETITPDRFLPYQNEIDSIIVYAHWGPELYETPSISQQQLAHQWIDMGADMVIGTGPHVIQPAELYHNRPILYSLGNFLFDMNTSPKTASGLIITGKITKDTIVLQPMLTTHTDLKPLLIRSKQGDDIISNYFADFKDFLSSDKGGIQFSISK